MALLPTTLPAALWILACAAAAPQPFWTGAVPEAAGLYGLIPGKFNAYQVVLSTFRW